MFEQERTLFGFNREYCRELRTGLSDETLWTSPSKGVHPAGWILGHLAIAFDYARSLLGGERKCPAPWHVMFGPGSSDEVRESRRPTLAELEVAIESGHDDVLANLNAAHPDTLAQPHQIPFEILKQTVPTNRDLLAHLMTTHYATHLGQLSVCRRVLGLEKLF